MPFDVISAWRPHVLKCGVPGQRVPYLTACSMLRAWRSCTSICGSDILVGRSLTILWTSKLLGHQACCVWKSFHSIFNESEICVICSL